MLPRYLPFVLLYVASVVGAEPKRDRFGDPLPEGAIARLGDLRLRHHTSVAGGDFSPDGKIFAAYEGGREIICWDTTSGRQVRRVPVSHHGSPDFLRYSPDGKRLILGGDRRNFYIIDAVTGAERVKLEQRMPQYPYNDPHAVDLSRDGTTAVTVYSGKNLVVWDLIKGKRRGEFKIQTELKRFAFQSFALTTDGKRLVLPHEDGSLYLADMRTGKELLAFEMSPNSTRNGPPRVTISPNEGAIEETRFEIKRNPNGKSPRFNEPDNLKLSCWRWKTNRVKQQIVAKTSKVYDEFVRSPNGRRGQNYSGITYSADGRCVAMPDKRICIREVATGKDRLQLSLPKQSYTGRADLALSPDGRFLACSCYGDNVGNVFVFSTSTGKLLARWRAKHGTCEAVAFSRDGRMLATGGYDGTILVWKIPENDDLPGVLSEEETATFWQALDSDDAARANRALAGLAAAPSQAVPLIQKRFPTTWKNLDRKQIARWIAELDDDSFQAREQATRELRRVGSDAAAALREALTKAPSPEAKRRIKGILNLLSKGNRPKYLRELRAIEVLERIGTPQAKDVLRSLAGKKLPPDLGEEVQASLRRLGDKP